MRAFIDRRSFRCLAAAAATVSLATEALADPPPLTPLAPGLNQSTYAGQLQSTVFATGLSFPTSMQAYAGGVLVGSTQDGAFYSSTSTGHLVLLTDTDGDGKANNTADLTPVGGLTGSVTSVRQAGNLLLVTSQVGTQTPTITVMKQGATPTSKFVTLGKVNLAFSTANWSHTSYALATRPTPGQAGSYDVFFNLGSRVNATSDAGNFATHHVTAEAVSAADGAVAGLNAVTLEPESIYKSTVTYSGAANTASFSAPVKVAGGLRNAAGLAIDTSDGALYYQDNGIDGGNDSHGNTAFSLDTLHRLSAADVGVVQPGTNFPNDYYQNTRPNPTKIGAPDALVAFAPFGPFDAADSASPNESEGPNEIAVAPANFPVGLRHGVFVGFHGQFDRTGVPGTGAVGNEENPVVFYDLDTKTYFHFIGTGEANVGHLDGLLSTPDALYLSDIANGSLYSSVSTAGTIYRIAAVPEPTAAALLAGALPLLARRRHR